MLSSRPRFGPSVKQCVFAGFCDFLASGHLKQSKQFLSVTSRRWRGQADSHDRSSKRALCPSSVQDFGRQAGLRSTLVKRLECAVPCKPFRKTVPSFALCRHRPRRSLPASLSWVAHSLPTPCVNHQAKKCQGHCSS